MSAASRRVSGRFWVVPAGCGVTAVVLAFVLARLDRAVGDTASAFLFPGPPEGPAASSARSSPQ